MLAPLFLRSSSKKLGWQNQFKEVSLQFREIGAWIPAKPPMEGTLLTASVLFLTQGLPGTDILGSEFLGREGAEPCGGGSHQAPGTA